MRELKMWLLMTVVVTLLCRPLVSLAEQNGPNLERISVSRGICVVLGDTRCELGLKLAKETDLLIYVQLQRDEDVEAACHIADAAGFYGTRIFVEKGALTRIHLADNLADALVAIGKATGVSEVEALWVLRPRGKALLERKELVKPFPEGVDEWSHPYHGPDNNPQSKDEIARAPYLTQFLAEPRYAPMPQAAVASAGRVFKAFGHVAFKKREELLLNTLVAFNGYNGTILWKRDLTPGFMVHRNTMIATPSTLYIGDDKSCKLIDTATGRLKDKITPPVERWRNILEVDGARRRRAVCAHRRTGAKRPNKAVALEDSGWPWDPISEGFNQPEHPWGFGQNVLAIDTKTKKVLWSHREDEPIDSRAMCMKNGRIYIFRFGSFLACLDVKTGRAVWRKTPDNAPELFEALGIYLDRQDWRTNWRTTTYLKCSDKALYFAGPPVGKLLTVSADDGSILWENPYNNFQLVLRDDGLYGISGEIDNYPCKKFDLLTGKVLTEINKSRRGCTRPTGSVDAIFYRASGGTVRLDVASNCPQWISPMRPQCHDGVTIANGLLYWWPSVCDCQLTLYGVTCLGPAGDFDFTPQVTDAQRLEKGTIGLTRVANLSESPADWSTFRGDNTGSATTEAVIAETNELLWQFSPRAMYIPTAPVTAGGLVFFSGSDGVVRALDLVAGKLRWSAYTGGSVRFPPTVWKGRALVGSGDGWVYCFEAGTGKLIWRFHAAPEERKIVVYGSLLSTWPVASGVLVENGIAYAAAGIVNYDGTYVYALDAATGKVKWQNNTSGHLDRQARTGVSVQGHQLLYDGKLYLASGTSISPAIYDITDGRCLNDPKPLARCESRSPRGWELFLLGGQVVACGKPFYAHPKYEVFDRTVSDKVLLTSSGDRDIVWVNEQRHKKVMCFSHIDRQLLSKSMADPNNQFNVKWSRLGIYDKPLWEYDSDEIVTLAVCSNAVVIAKESEIVALNLLDGKMLWSQPVTSTPVPWGLAVDRKGHVIVTLEDGKVLCLGRNSRS